jgi:hypothetical protein
MSRARSTRTETKPQTDGPVTVTTRAPRGPPSEPASSLADAANAESLAVLRDDGDGRVSIRRGAGPDYSEQ